MTSVPIVPERTTPDLAALMLLAQPMRLRIGAQLRHGPASSAALAQILGESIDLANFYLEQMAEHGLIEEIPGLPDDEKRWWRSARTQPHFPPRKEHTPEMRALIDEMNRINFAADLDDLMRAQLEQDDSGSGAFECPYSRDVIHVTPSEFAEFLAEYASLLGRYQHPSGDVAPGARAVLTRFIAFPAPAPPVAEAANRPGNRPLPPAPRLPGATERG